MNNETTGSRPAISIVLPVFKAVNTLAQCIESVLAQSFTDIELLCIDDGSSDGSAEVLDTYACRDERVRVISQKNQGVSVARNTGINAALGNIVMFIDADDAYAENACAEVAAAFVEDPQLEAFVFGAVCEPEQDAPKHVRELLSPVDSLYERSATGAVDPVLFFGAHAQPYAWRAAFTRNFLDREDLRFVPGLALAEDAAFQIVAYSLAARTRLSSQVLYRYRMDSDSATHRYNASASRERKMEQHLVAIGAIFEAWRARGLADFYLAPMITWCMDLLLFDLARVDEEEALKVAVKLSALFAEAYGADWFSSFKDAQVSADPKHAPNRAILRVARAIDRAPRTQHFQLGTIDLVRFFVATRGMKQCVERFI